MTTKSSDERIVYLCPNGFLGGAEKFVIDTCLGHLKYGSLKPVILFFSDGLAVEQARKLGITSLVLKNSFRLSKPWHLLKALREIRTLFKRFNWNIYHATMAYSQIVGALAIIGLPVKRVWYQHGPVAQRLDMIASFFRVDKILFNSSYTQMLHHTAPSFNYPSKGECVIPPGIEDHSANEDIVKEIRNKYRRGGILLMMAGRIAPFKQYELVINALNIVFTKNPSLKDKFRLIIVGGATKSEDQDYYQDLLKNVEQFKLSENIFFVGSQNNMADYYKACDLVIHTPKNPEPFGLVIAEAMNYAKLVIAPDTGGTADFLIPYKTGIPLDTTAKELPESIAYQIQNVIESLLKNDLVFSKIEDQARVNISKKFSLERTIKSLETCYQNLFLEKL